MYRPTFVNVERKTSESARKPKSNPDKDFTSLPSFVGKQPDNALWKKLCDASTSTLRRFYEAITVRNLTLSVNMY